MSIIRRRKLHIFYAWLMGMATVGIIFGGLILFMKFDIVAYLKPEKLEEPVEVMVEQIVAARPIASKTILDEDDLIVVEIPETLAVNNEMTLEEFVGQKIIIDVDQGLPMTKPMLAYVSYDNPLERLYEFDFVRLPFLMEVGDVVDIRIVFPNGQDYVVLSHKEVVNFQRSEEDVHAGLISLKVEEEEVLRLSSALVDRILTESASIYTVKYVDPINQKPSQISYPVNRSVLSVLEENPNLLTVANLSDWTVKRELLDTALKELLDEDDEWFSLFDSLAVDGDEERKNDQNVDEEINNTEIISEEENDLLGKEESDGNKNTSNMSGF